MVITPWFFLKNLDIAFNEEMVFLFEEDMEEQLESHFSDSKVPVLVDGDLSIWDSLAIIETIADMYPNKNSWPKDAQARAIARSISAEMHSGYPALRNALPMNCRKHFPNHSIDEDVQKEIDRIVAVWEFCKNTYGADDPWLFGKFSGADAMFAPIVIRFTGFDIKLTGFAKEYCEAVMQNTHIKRWIDAGRKETQVIEMNEV